MKEGRKDNKAVIDNKIKEPTLETGWYGFNL